MATEGFHGRFTLTGRSLRTGRVLFERSVDNGVKLAALDFMHRAALAGGTVYTTYGASLILDAGYTGHSPADTRAAHPGWTDLAQGGGTLCIEAMARGSTSNGQATYTPYQGTQFLFCPNNTFVRGVSFYANLTTTGPIGYQLNSGSLLFSTAVLSGAALYVNEPGSPGGGQGQPPTPPPAVVAISVGYVLSAKPFDP